MRKDEATIIMVRRDVKVYFKLFSGQQQEFKVQWKFVSHERVKFRKIICFVITNLQKDKVNAICSVLTSCSLYLLDNKYNLCLFQITQMILQVVPILSKSLTILFGTTKHRIIINYRYITCTWQSIYYQTNSSTFIF